MRVGSTHESRDTCHIATVTSRHVNWAGKFGHIDDQSSNRCGQREVCEGFLTPWSLVNTIIDVVVRANLICIVCYANARIA